jgi:hypothetical protein
MVSSLSRDGLQPDAAKGALPALNLDPPMFLSTKPPPPRVGRSPGALLGCPEGALRDSGDVLKVPFETFNVLKVPFGASVMS